MNKNFIVTPNLDKCDTYKKILDELIDCGWNKEIKLDDDTKYLLCYQYAKEIGVEEKEFTINLSIDDLRHAINNFIFALNFDECNIDNVKNQLIKDYIDQILEDLQRTKERIEKEIIEDYYEEPIDPQDIVTIKKEE